MNIDEESMGEACESRVLRSVTGGPSKSFFDHVWQKQCKLYRFHDQSSLTGTSNENTDWNDENMDEYPLEEIIRMGWSILVALLQAAKERYQDVCVADDNLLPLIFCDQQCVSITEAQALYGENLFAAYLDGCSIVLNHADLLSPYVAALCLDLQKSFPHAYANSYLTPPMSKAVPAHADDRDVLVFQIVGQKHWKVYQQVPIPYPYPHEQVGKDGLEIPPSVLEGPCLIDTVLNPGDVLYMPRGFVHEAFTHPTQLSFHVTVALATHDWTLAGIVTSATQHTLSRVVEYRMAAPLSFGMQDLPLVPASDKEFLQKQLDDAFAMIREQVTVESISRNMRYKHEQHNRRSEPRRKARIHAARFPRNSFSAVDVVGPEAANNLTLSSVVRCSTAEEKSRVPPSPRPRGLHVREATADALMGVLKVLKSETLLQISVSNLLSLVDTDSSSKDLICNLSLLSFAKCCVELGAMAVVSSKE